MILMSLRDGSLTSFWTFHRMNYKGEWPALHPIPGMLANKSHNLVILTRDLT